MTRVVCVVVALGLLAGCTPQARPGFDGIASPSPTPDLVPRDAGPDPAGVPDVIDEAYVDAVADALYAAEGDVLRAVLRSPAGDGAALPEQARDRLAVLFVGDELATRTEQARALATDPAARDGLLPAADFTGLAFDVERVAYADDSCLVALVRVRRDGVATDPVPPGGLSALSLSLSRLEALVDGNPTTWQARDLLANTDSDGNTNDDDVLREATLEDFGEALDHTCEGETSRRP